MTRGENRCGETTERLGTGCFWTARGNHGWVVLGDSRNVAQHGNTEVEFGLDWAADATVETVGEHGGHCADEESHQDASDECEEARNTGGARGSDGWLT